MALSRKGALCIYVYGCTGTTVKTILTYFTYAQHAPAARHCDDFSVTWRWYYSPCTEYPLYSLLLHYAGTFALKTPFLYILVRMHEQIFIDIIVLTIFNHLSLSWVCHSKAMTKYFSCWPFKIIGNAQC